MRPLTNNMIKHLRMAYELELEKNGNNVCTCDHYKGTLSGLYRRGLVATKQAKVEGKEITVVYITEAGISFLNNYLR